MGCISSWEEDTNLNIVSVIAHGVLQIGSMQVFHSNGVVVGVFTRAYWTTRGSMAEVAPFSIWMRAKVLEMQASHGYLNPAIMCLSRPPHRFALSFKRMTAHSAHYRVDAEEGSTHYATCDYGISRIGAQVSTLCGDQLGSVGVLERVGILKEILVVSFYTMRVVLMRGSWVMPNIGGVPTIMQDMHGFWLAHLDAQPRDESSAFLLPSLVTQVSYNTSMLALYLAHAGNPGAWLHLHVRFHLLLASIRAFMVVGVFLSLPGATRLGGGPPKRWKEPQDSGKGSKACNWSGRVQWRETSTSRDANTEIKPTDRWSSGGGRNRCS